MMLCYRSICSLILALLASVVAWKTQAGEDVRWHIGEPLRKALLQKAGLTWANVPLRPSLTRFCRTQRVAFVLDRRIDPDQKIELSFDDVPLNEALQRIASRLNAGVAMVGPVVYFGPMANAENVRTVAALAVEQTTKLPSAARKLWIQLRPLKWPDATSPGDLLAGLAQENKFTIQGLELVPYDLWAAGDLPTMSLAERLTLILTQFDLTFEIAADGSSIALMPQPNKARIERSYNVAGSAQEAAARLRENSIFSGAEISHLGSRVVIRARQEDHDAIKTLLAGGQAKRTQVRETTKQVYTLRVQLPADKLLEALGKRLELDIRIDRDAIAARGLSVEKEVRLDVKGVTAEQLLKAVLDPVGLTFKRNGNVVEVVPK